MVSSSSLSPRNPRSVSPVKEKPRPGSTVSLQLTLRKLVSRSEVEEVEAEEEVEEWE
jgi:hypothetical protein